MNLILDNLVHSDTSSSTIIARISVGSDVLFLSRASNGFSITPDSQSYHCGTYIHSYCYVLLICVKRRRSPLLNEGGGGGRWR